ncbi:hypothetical protein B0H16DRAFT_858512 [Mycena metata]|uniref:DUF6532 domain-containing protein n=1 Tax=Mycena metata TaxID=1033252 RepID=A0AAD7N9G3_9AGAR|nr:hypothetical protein B0H16DRAFT_858512 [Mycena metata]
MSLTPQEKASQTRRANRAREEFEARQAANSVVAPRRAKTTATQQTWLPDGSKIQKRSATDPPALEKKSKVPKRNSGTAAVASSRPSRSRAPVAPNIDHSDEEPKPVKSAPKPRAPSQPNAAKKKSPVPPPVPRSLQAPAALAKHPPATPHTEQEDESHSDNDHDGNSHDSNELDEEELEDEDADDMNVEQFKAEAATWAPENDPDTVNFDADMHEEDQLYTDVRMRSRSGSVSSGFDLHVPTSGSEPTSDADDAEAHSAYADIKYQNDSDEEYFRQNAPPRRRISRSRAVMSEESEDDRERHHDARVEAPHNNHRSGANREPPNAHPHHQTERRRERSQHRSDDRPVRSKADIPPKRQSKGIIVRKEKALRERPVWGSANDDAGPVPSGPSRQAEARQLKADVTLPSTAWPDTPPLTFTARGVLNLNSQASRIQHLLRQTFVKVTGDILLVNAFPDVGERLKYSRDALNSVSKSLGYAAITERLRKDDVYSKEIAKVADARWTDTRRTFKQAAIPAATHTFDLKPGCSERVQALLATPHSDYIYPAKDGVIDYSKPFCNPAVVSTIHQSIFVGKKSWVTTYQARIPVTDGPTPERMIPKVTAALGATAVVAALQDWQGPQYVSNEFNANLFAETYLTHLNFLEQMEKQSPVAYQNVLVRLYRLTSGQGKVVAPRAATGTNLLAHLDLSALETLSD